MPISRSNIRSAIGTIFALVVLILFAAIGTAMAGINVPGLNIISGALGF